MDKTLLKLSAVIGVCALCIAVCAASPKYDTNSSKGYDEMMISMSRDSV